MNNHDSKTVFGTTPNENDFKETAKNLSCDELTSNNNNLDQEKLDILGVKCQEKSLSVNATNSPNVSSIQPQEMAQVKI